RLPDRRVPDHGRGAASRRVDVLRAQPRHVSAEDLPHDPPRPAGGRADEGRPAMTTPALLVIGVVALCLLVVVLDQVRRAGLYVGYGVVLVLAIVGLVVIAAVPPLLHGLTRLVGAAVPGSALVLLSLAFILIVLVYVLTQVTIVANRVAAVVQELA